MIAEALRRCSHRDLDTFARFAAAADPAVGSYWRALLAWERSRRAIWAAAAMDGAGGVPRCHPAPPKRAGRLYMRRRRLPTPSSGSPERTRGCSRYFSRSPVCRNRRRPRHRGPRPRLPFKDRHHDRRMGRTNRGRTRSPAGMDRGRHLPAHQVRRRLPGRNGALSGLWRCARAGPRRRVLRRAVREVWRSTHVLRLRICALTRGKAPDPRQDLRAWLRLALATGA